MHLAIEGVLFMSGEYVEKLSTGGELHIAINSWHIRYYFQGPDLRYNGTFVYVYDKEIDAYMEAWKENYKKYVQLKTSIPSNGQFETQGLKGMSIRIGGFHEGVCIKSYHMPINNEMKINEIINEYKSAKEKALKVQNMLRLL